MNNNATQLDPFFPLVSSYAAAAFNDKRGRQLENPRTWTGRIGTFITDGQSLGSNSCDATYVPVNVGKVHNLNLLDGGIYALADPMLGTDVGAGRLGNMFTRVADKLVSAGLFNHVVIVPTNLGGTSVAQWDASLWQDIPIAHARCLAAGLTPLAILDQQGETDNALGTSRDVYRGTKAHIITMVRNVGITVPWFLAKSTYYNGNTSAAIRGAIDDLVASDPNIHAGPDTDTVTLRQPADNTHLTGAGADVAAAQWVTALDAVF